MLLQPHWRDALAHGLEVFPDTLHVEPVARQAFRVSGPGIALFVKTARQAARLDAEAAGLAALHGVLDPEAVRLPAVHASGRLDDGAWLALSWLELIEADARSDRTLGHVLAALHQAQATSFGWDADNFIGGMPQHNPRTGSAVEFLREARLGPQLAWASERGAPAELIDSGARLLDKLDNFYTDYRPVPSLLHGDLWSGNRAAVTDGLPALYDPAVHYGDREADLAMSELFGGFASDFYLAYDEVWPRDPGYAVRRDLHQLYHVLNHFNLFSGGYAQQALRLIRRLLAQV